MDTLLIAVVAFIVYFSIKLITERNITNISFDELLDIMKDSKTNREFVDVRTLDEFRRDKVKGFKCIPLNQLKKRIKELDQDKEIYLICQSGSRSKMAAKQLLANGYKKVFQVKKGLNGRK